MKFIFIIQGAVKAKERPRHGRGKTYTPRSTTNYEQRSVWGEAVVAGIRQGTFGTKPMYLSVLGVFKPAKEHGDHPIKTDIDNILKIVMDGLAPAFDDNNDTHFVSAFVAKKFTDEYFTREQVIVKITDSKEDMES